MIIAPFFDISLGVWLFIMLGIGLSALVAFGLVVLLEAVVLWLMEWNSFLRSLFDSFLANLFTTLLGVYLGPTPSTFNYIHDPGFIPRFVIFWGLSVLIEGGLILLIRRQPWVKTFKAVCIMNISSYIFLYLLLHVLFVLYNG